jgi:rhodanese-related sulfurtransferase
VREGHEFRGDLGHVPGAQLVPLSHVSQAARSWNRDDDIVVVCRSGGRSAHAAAELARLGSRASNMVGGMLRWNAEKREIAR